MSVIFSFLPNFFSIFFTEITGQNKKKDSRRKYDTLSIHRKHFLLKFFSAESGKKKKLNQIISLAMFDTKARCARNTLLL